tara:strand:+ start:108 stop:842 length:735 start_codon:yes stop_codon:yes gene_type:complete
MSKCSLVLPLAGLGSRFAKEGYINPKPFIDVKGKPMISQVLENLNYKSYSKIVLVIRAEFDKEFKSQLTTITKSYNCEIVSVPKLTDGPAITVLEGLKYVNLDDPLLVANTDQIVDEGVTQLVSSIENSSCHGNIMCFKDETKNPKWSFVKLDNKNRIIETREKVPISDLATVGIYGFSKASYCKNAIEEMVRNKELVNNEYYVCPSYNYMIKNKLTILPTIINSNSMHGIGTPDDLKIYLKTN